MHGGKGRARLCTSLSSVSECHLDLASSPEREVHVMNTRNVVNVFLDLVRF